MTQVLNYPGSVGSCQSSNMSNLIPQYFNPLLGVPLTIFDASAALTCLHLGSVNVPILCQIIDDIEATAGHPVITDLLRPPHYVCIET